MSGFNSFLGGFTAGQGANQRRQSAFNDAMLSQGHHALQAEKLDQMKANRQLVRDAGAAYEGGDFDGAQVKAAQGGNTDLAAAFGQMSDEQRQGVKDRSQRIGKFAAAIQTLAPEQQGPAIMEFGPDFDFDPETVQKAAANPGAALTALSSEVRDIETMIAQSIPVVRPVGDQFYGIQTGPGGTANVQNLTPPSLAHAGRPELHAQQDANTQFPANPIPTSRLKPRLQPFSDAHAQSAILGHRAAISNTQIDEIVGQGYNRSGFRRGGIIASQNTRKYERAQEEFINSLLQQGSGEDIDPSEYERAERQYFPEFGDSPETMEAKREARQRVVDSLKRQSQGAYQAFYPESGNGPPMPRPKSQSKKGEALSEIERNRLAELRAKHGI